MTQIVHSSVNSTQCAVLNVRNRYGSAIDFLNTMNPSIQIKAAANLMRTYCGDAPSLSILRKAYSQQVAEAWIMTQLENLNDFCGVSVKMNLAQMEELAGIIIVEAHFLKTSELMLFFHRFKSGRYGELYGAVDPQKILAGLFCFFRDRMQEIDKIQLAQRQEELKKNREKWEKEAVPCPSHLVVINQITE